MRVRGRVVGRALLDVVVGGSQVGAALLSAPLLRRRYNRWGAGDAELVAPMADDELVPDPRLGYTRAITIGAPAATVWSWLVQIGQGRGGLYSFDGLENLVGCRIHSVDRIIPELQHVEPGDLIRMGPEGYPCFRVHAARMPTELVLIGADPKPPHAAAPSDGPGRATWQFALRPVDNGLATRLVVRQRLSYPHSMRVVWHLVEPVGFVMERQMLRRIKRHAEATAATRNDPGGAASVPAPGGSSMTGSSSRVEVRPVGHHSGQGAVAVVYRTCWVR